MWEVWVLCKRIWWIAAAAKNAYEWKYFTDWQKIKRNFSPQDYSKKQDSYLIFFSVAYTRAKLYRLLRIDQLTANCYFLNIFLLIWFKCQSLEIIIFFTMFHTKGNFYTSLKFYWITSFQNKIIISKLTKKVFFEYFYGYQYLGKENLRKLTEGKKISLYLKGWRSLYLNLLIETPQHTPNFRVCKDFLP